jgi:hypothetical protein
VLRLATDSDHVFGKLGTRNNAKTLGKTENFTASSGFTDSGRYTRGCNQERAGYTGMAARHAGFWFCPARSGVYLSKSVQSVHLHRKRWKSRINIAFLVHRFLRKIGSILE